MKNICITKYIHSFTINKYKKTILDKKTYNSPLVKTINNLRYQPGCASGYIAGYEILNRTYADLKNPIIKA